MKYFKLFENFDEFDGEFVGIHCSNYEIEEFRGDITDEDFIRFADILHTIKEDYPEASKYLEMIGTLDVDDEEENEDVVVELASDIAYFFKKNNLEWIYVSNNEPLYKYGNNCYNVYFENEHDVYFMSDDLVNDATVCVYNSITNKPKLFPY